MTTELVKFGISGNEDVNVTDMEHNYELVDSFKFLGAVVSSQNKYIAIRNTINLATRQTGKNYQRRTWPR